MSADEEVDSDYEEDIDDQMDNDEIDDKEEGFLKGYDSAEEDPSTKDDFDAEDEIKK